MGAINCAAHLEFILLERFERRGPAAQGVILGDPVENVDAAIMEQRRLRNRAPGRAGTERALLQRLFTNALNGFEAVPFGTFVLVERHRRFF